VFVPPRNGAEENHLRDPRGARFARAQVALSALKSAIMHLGTLRDSRKTVLYLGLDYSVGPETSTATRDVIQAANAANVAVYSINPQGLRVSGSNFRSGLLANIAHGTGGESFLSNSPARAMGRVMAQSSASYLLGYAPAPLRHDGAFHKIRITVQGPGLQVRARSGYLAPDAAQRAAARAAAAEAVLPPAIEEAFGELAWVGRPEAEQRSRLVRTILSPATPSADLAVVSPTIRLIRTPADLKAARSGTPPPPHTGREFVRTDRLLMTVMLAGDGAARATLSMRLIDRRGKPLTDLPFSRAGAGWELDLPLQLIARGDYLIAVAAEDGERQSTAYVPIRIR
jgi:hypothetical protein